MSSSNQTRMVTSLLLGAMAPCAVVMVLAMTDDAQAQTKRPRTRVDASVAATDDGATNQDLVQMGAGLLDNKDLVRLGSSLIPAAQRAAAASDASALGDGGDDDGGDAALPFAEPDAAPALSADAAAADAGFANAAVAASDPNANKPPSRPGPGTARDRRIESGENLPLKGLEDSPLTKLGIPAKAVPAVATVATAGAMSIWPFLTKTLTGLLKKLAAGFLKKRAKKDKKIDGRQRVIEFRGFRIRPLELGAILLGAAVYGLAVCYGFQGWKMKPRFVVQQETLIVTIYYLRSVIRFVYERTFKLTTQFKFWAGGAALCLGSAYLGNTLGTVGYDLEDASKPEDSKRLVKMKAWLIVFALVGAIGFCVANLVAPTKLLQSARVMMSGMALGEVLPIAPMPGQKIYAWRKDVFAALLVAVIVTFFAVNFFL